MSRARGEYVPGMHGHRKRSSLVGRKYAVLWAAADGVQGSGRLEVLPDRIELSSKDALLAVSFEEVQQSSIGRRPGDRLRGLPVLSLDRGDGVRLSIASLEGTGALYEIAGLFDGAAPSVPIASGT